MKKLFLLSLTVLFLAACQNSEEQSAPVKETVKENEPSQEELNAELKEEAVQANFVELNVEDPPEGKKVYAEGTVSLLTEGALDEFTLTTNEESGNGMYKIVLANTTEIEFSEGDKVKVYGGVAGKDEIGMPEILATIIEKVD